MPVYTTFKKLRKANACKERYALLRKNLKGVRDNDKIDLIDILESNGLNDVLWIPESALSGDNISKRYRLFAVACCQDILHLMQDQRSLDAVKIAHLYAYGEVKSTELAAAWAAARDAACDAAWDTAWGAARRAARDAAWGAARDAAWGAAWEDAAWEDAAWEDAAWGATRERQKQHFKIIFNANFDE
ncbi:MAG: hypothetical protein ACE5RH_00555 [Nitrosarchaeum sp.]